MTHPPGGYARHQGTQDPPSTPQVAKHEAAEVGSTAAEGGRQVMDTAGEQTKRVAREAGQQARNLMHESRQQLTDQAREGQRKAAQGLHTLADQLDDMYAKSDQSGMGPEMIHQAAGHTRTVASWLDDRQPGDLLNEVRDFARRKPGMFLAGAALAGMLVGRLTRGAIDTQRDESADDNTTDKIPAQPGPAPTTTSVPPSYPPTRAPAPGYTTPPAPAYSQPPVEGQVPPTGYPQQAAHPGQTQTPPPWNGPESVRP
ncbi:hypothetical protein KIPE111705_42530 [Kibdelosporangium persicum]|uniref:DUF3618 domain-containing protein n=1 Tax=Kibdelosporangium persicum TaxID=2698649 RepID=A0ABX2EW31_9PSEU|nr:hypothetical protein [Kibdelosporangium persicum]NRN63174.1 hypothetical protein [Kibdelosporangium persicum]